MEKPRRSYGVKKTRENGEKARENENKLCVAFSPLTCIVCAAAWWTRRELIWGCSTDLVHQSAPESNELNTMRVYAEKRLF